MPLIHLYYERGSVTDPIKAKLANRLTDVIIEIEGGGMVDGTKARSIAYVLLHEMDAGNIAIGGTIGDDTHVEPPGKFIVVVRVPEGSLSNARKSAIHASVDEIFREVFELGEAPAERTPSVLTTIDEWSEGSLGAMGRTYRLADIGAYIGPGNPANRAYSAAYLAARHRARETAGYPES
jgi:phenylpyruvate tautomerase PptA (4-oxalocrotonate tautomerase family)